MRLPIYSVTLIPLLLAAAVTTTRAQTTEARISVVSLSPPRVRVEGSRSPATRVWSFRNAYAGISGLGERLKNLSLSDERGANVPVRELSPGEYTAERDATRFSYEISLDLPTAADAAAHVSWLAGSRGALMPGDLLPLPLSHARLSFKLPDAWRVASNERANEAGVYDLADAESFVAFAGGDVRERAAKVRGMDLTVAFAGDWAFTDEDAVGIVTAMVKGHAKTFDGVPRKSALVVIAPFPRPSAASQWAAETRGATVLYLSGRAPAKVSALARLGAPLAHELFHLWVPNGLGLAGDYGWFYEGFTNYQALRASQRLGDLNFNDYLDSLARASDAYDALKGQDTVSLLEASSRRWSGSNALVYHKGMLVAALYDLKLRSATGGKRSLDDVYRALFRRAQSGSRGLDANAVALGTLEELLGGREFTDRFIRGARIIDLAAELQPYGLRLEKMGARSRVVVSSSLRGAQRDLLRQIGLQ
ncbi:MAG TPA: hypothetical protein VM864_16915 [Pyrinomonadaceae bacterium]|jgi:hypothetical protein|nr:hypothetical protein [Pyrinomonadaceae bacterium]